MMRNIFRSWVWAKGVIEDESELWDLRIWLPLWDLVLLTAGIWAATFGSPILNRLFPGALVDVAGIAMAFAATVCLVSVLWPQLFAVEFFGKAALMFLLSAYAATVLLYRRDPDDLQSVFVVFMLIAAIIPAPSRMMKIGGQWGKRQRAKKEAEEAVRAAIAGHRIGGGDE